MFKSSIKSLFDKPHPDEKEILQYLKNKDNKNVENKVKSNIKKK